jgi:hypothetical protein
MTNMPTAPPMDPTMSCKRKIESARAKEGNERKKTNDSATTITVDDEETPDEGAEGLDDTEDTSGEKRG